MKEKDLLNRLKEGDQRAFQEFVEQYKQMVFSTCFNFLHDKQNADDVAQEVFIEVFRKMESFRSEAKISTWLYRISVNRSLNYIRDNKKHSILKRLGSFFGGEEENDYDPADEKLNPQDLMEDSENVRSIRKAIEDLPENQRIAFNLHKFEDLSYKEICEIMDLSLSSVESLIHRAKKNLQKKLIKLYKSA